MSDVTPDFGISSRPSWMNEPGLDTPLIDPIDILTGLVGIARVGILKALEKAPQVILPRIAGSFAEGTVGAARVKIIQYGDHVLRKSTISRLNEFFDVNLSPSGWREVIHALKRGEGLTNNFHGNIDAVGNYLDKAGNIIGNLGHYLR